MANVSIPNLPSQTATTDLDLLVITDSGETTTSKITKADFLDGVGGGKLVDANLTGTDNLYIDGYLPTYTDAATTLKNINFGFNTSANITGERNMVLGTNNITYIYGGTDNTLIGGQFNQIYNTSINSGLFSCNNSSLRSTYSAILGGRDNNIQSASDYGVIVGGRANNLNGDDYNIIGGGQNNTINTGAQRAGIFASYGTSIGIGADYSSVLSSQFTNVTGQRNHAVGTQNGTIAGTGSYNSIFGSYNSRIDSNDDYNTIINSKEVQIGDFGGTDAVSGNTVLGCSNITIGDFDNVSLIGVSNYTASTDNVVVVPQLVMTEYSSLNFADDTAAATGGVVLGGLYHNNGALRVRVA